MRPETVVVRPPRGERGHRLHFWSRVRFPFPRRRISLYGCARDEAGEKDQRQNGSHHIFGFGLRFAPGGCGAKVAGQRLSESAQTIRGSRREGNSNAYLFLLIVPSTARLEKNVRWSALPP